MGTEDAVALATGAGALAYVVRDLDAGAACIDQALLLNPNLMWASYFAGSSRVAGRAGVPPMAHLTHAMRLSPVDPLMPLMQMAIAHAHFFAGRYDDASSWATAALRGTPNLLPALRIGAAADALAGHLEPAQKAVARLLQLNPNERVSNLEDIFGPIPASGGSPEVRGRAAKSRTAGYNCMRQFLEDWRLGDCSAAVAKTNDRLPRRPPPAARSPFSDPDIDRLMVHQLHAQTHGRLPASRFRHGSSDPRLVPIGAGCLRPAHGREVDF